MVGSPREVLPGYRVRILDGSHLRATERRLDVHRMRNGAPLPGQSLVVLDPRRMLIEDVIPCEGGHSQDRAILHELVEDLCPGDVWIADRNFCTSIWLREIALNESWVIIRQHANVATEELTELVPALLAYALALVTYSLPTVVKAAVAAAHGEESAESMSTYYMADEIASTQQGTEIALPWDEWLERYGSLSPPSSRE